MTKECKHNWKKVYYRKVVKGKTFQEWRTIPNKFICDKCEKIKELR